HCQMANVKVYARHNPDSGWVMARDPQWMPLHGTPNSRHSLIIARTGACLGHGPNQPASKIARDLASPADSRFDGQGKS
ncbi:MAG TPA: CNP1-like family protein, partial [Ramlibacter sp.]|nr:CNP1-like family protein [Ramlibacter sp.]